MPDDADQALHDRVMRQLRDRDAAAETELGPAASDAEHELARKPPLIREMHAIFYNDPKAADARGRIFVDEGQAWAYGNALKLKPRRVTIIVERD